MIYAVTGKHTMLTEEEKWYVRKIVKRNVLRRKSNKLVSGMAFGVDTEAILAVWGLLPFENITCTVPGTAQHNWGLVERLEGLGANIIKCPTLHTARDTFLNRDKVTIDQLPRSSRGVLLGFPNKPTFYRSGTWATINEAERQGKKFRLYPLINAV